MAKTNMADPYWQNLFSNVAGGTKGKMPAPPTGGMMPKLKGVAKRFGPELIGWMLLQKYLDRRNQNKMQDIQMEAARGQAELSSPENLYYQAAMPQAQAEEEQARNALLSTLSGGVIGPSLPRGYRVIGGG